MEPVGARQGSVVLWTARGGRGEKKVEKIKSKTYDWPHMGIEWDKRSATVVEKGTRMAGPGEWEWLGLVAQRGLCLAAHLQYLRAFDFYFSTHITAWTSFLFFFFFCLRILYGDMCPCRVFMCPCFLPEDNWNADIFLFGAHCWILIGQVEGWEHFGVPVYGHSKPEVEKHTE